MKKQKTKTARRNQLVNTPYISGMNGSTAFAQVMAEIMNPKTGLGATHAFGSYPAIYTQKMKGGQI